jgi:hypothetical protein
VQALVRQNNRSKRAVYDFMLPLGLQAYSSTGDCRQIVTGVSERGSETELRYWIQPRISKRTQARPKSAKERMAECLVTYVGRDIFPRVRLANLYPVEDRIGDCCHCSLLIVLVLRYTAHRLGFWLVWQHVNLANHLKIASDWKVTARSRRWRGERGMGRGMNFFSVVRIHISLLMCASGP